ncbi:MAG: hypothetical protein WDZ88_00925 [Candidatus Paceibacterota bacterium]
MHKLTKLTPVMRKEVFEDYQSGEYSLRSLGDKYHVDKKVVARIIERGEKGDFSVHKSVNHRFVSGADKRRKTVPKLKKVLSGKNAKRK